jgi:hypothetical protein
VTILGSDFVLGATVKFGAVSANVISMGTGQIQTTTPPGTVGTVNVTVTNSNSLSGTLNNGFTYQTQQTVRFVQAAAATPQSAVSSVVLPYPAAQTAGNMNIVVVGWNDTAADVQSVQDSSGNLYTLAAGPIRGTGLSQSIYYGPLIAAGVNTVTVTFTQPAAYADRPDPGIQRPQRARYNGFGFREWIDR